VAKKKNLSAVRLHSAHAQKRKRRRKEETMHPTSAPLCRPCVVGPPLIPLPSRCRCSSSSSSSSWSSFQRRRHLLLLRVPFPGRRRRNGISLVAANTDNNSFDAFSQMPKETKTKRKNEKVDLKGEEIKASNWRPAPPDISTSAPREFSPISYALLGDSVWELFVRSYLFAPRSKPSTYDSKVKKLARAESQAYAYRKMTGVSGDNDGDYGTIQLTEEELDVCKWGRNADYSNVPKRLRGKKSQGGGHEIYRQASALEVILGWWMVTDDERLDEVLELVKTSGWLEEALEHGDSEEDEENF
jgi:ribonuclease-3 family protein